jgi:hypothetical protein
MKAKRMALVTACTLVAVADSAWSWIKWPRGTFRWVRDGNSVFFLLRQKWWARWKNSYVIPKWCRLSLPEHMDGIGGCWGISYGCVAEKGEVYCLKCEYHKGNAGKEPS